VAAIQREVGHTDRPILLTQSDVRRFVRRLIENEVPAAIVLSYQELDPSVTVQPLGRIAIGRSARP
jgi:type III secretory pathway component EscV